MKLMMIVILLLCGCSPEGWDGIPATKTCTDVRGTDHATCVADGKLYQCVKSNGRMLCTRDTVEIKCMNIVNVETVCPAKP